MSPFKSWWRRVRLGATPATARTVGHTVFVSYAHEDEARVRQLVDDLHQAGLKIWFASRGIRLGHSIEASVAQAIDDARHVLVACSKSAMGSAWVAREVAYALEREARLKSPCVIPVYLVSDDVPLRLRERLAVDLRAGRYDAGLKRLVDELIDGRMPQGIVPLAKYRAFVDSLPVVSTEVFEQLESCLLRAWTRRAWLAPESTLEDLRRGGIPIDTAQQEQRARTLERLERERRADEGQLEQRLLSSDLAEEVRRKLVKCACAGGVHEAVTADQRAEIRLWLRKGPSRECLAAAAYLFGFARSGYANGPFGAARIEQIREGWRARGEVDPSSMPALELFIDELLRLGVLERVKRSGLDEIQDANAATLVISGLRRSVGRSAYLYEAAALQDAALSPIGRLAHIESD